MKFSKSRWWQGGQILTQWVALARGLTPVFHGISVYKKFKNFHSLEVEW